MGEYVQNFTLTNCYVDTSDQQRNGTIITSKFSETEPQKEKIEYDFTIVANDGYKLNTDFSFDYQYQPKHDYNADEPWININQSLFKPLEKTLTWEWDFEHGDFKYSGLDLNKSMVYEHLNGDGTIQFVMLLVGGYSPYKMVFSVIGNGWGSIYYDGKRYSNKSFSKSLQDNYGNITGSESLLNNLLFVAESDKPIEPDITDNIYSVYYLDNKKLDEIRQSGTVSSEIIVNTYSYPINFNEELLKDTTIKTGFISQTIESKSFISNTTTIDLFIFDVPDVPDVTECYIRIPFNNNVNLKYEDIKGKTIRGYISYEMLTNTTTLFITDEVETLYKNVITIGIKIPYKPTGAFENYSDSDVRLAKEEPKLFIKGVGKSIKSNYLQGKIKEPINKILKDELDILNELLNKGVFINENNQQNEPQQ